MGNKAWTQNVSFSLQIVFQKRFMFQQIFSELCAQDVQKYATSLFQHLLLLSNFNWIRDQIS